MNHAYPSLLARWLPCPLAALGLLLATAGAAQAQAPTSATPASSGLAPYGPAQRPALVADPTLPGSPNLVAPTRTAAHVTARPATTQRLVTGWTTMAAMSQVRAEPGAAAHPNGKIYVWGGYGSGGVSDALASAEAYTPATNTWAAIASLPLALCGPATAVGTDGAIYSFGGRNGAAYYNNCYKYDVTANLWTAIAPLPVTRWEARALTAPDGRIFVFGGWNFNIPPSVGSEVQIYTPATNTWSTGAAMPVGLFGSAAGVDAAGLMHVYGGITTNIAPATTHLVYNVTTNSWATAPATPTPARAYTTGLAGPDGNLYLFGGDDNIAIGTAGAYYSQVDSYNPATATWSNEPALPVALTEAASATTGGNLYVVGGFNSTAQSALYRIAVVAAPALTSISPNPAMAGTSVTLTGSNLSGATAVTFTGTSNNTVTTGLTVNGSGSSQTITVAVPTGANTGNVTVTTPSGTSNGVAFTVTPPAAPVAVEPANNSTTNSSPIFLVTATPGSYLMVYLNGVNPNNGQYVVGSNGFIRAQYSGLADGVYTLYATATAQASGAPVSAPSNTLTFTVDGTAPTATLSTTAGTSTSRIPFSVSFSEPVTGLSASSFTVSNGTVTAGSLSGSGSGPYTFSVTPTGNGLVTVSLAANAVQDAVGNGNTASNSLSVQYTAPVASGLSVQYQTGDLGQPTDGQLRPFLQLVNAGTTAVPYSSLTIRYWLTAENFKGQLITPIDYAKLGTSFVSARYVALATPRQGALGYIEYSFAAGAGNLNPGTDSGPIFGKAYKPDYTNFDETDDWSYQTSSSFTTNSHVTVYQNGTLVNGTEPTAVAATIALQVVAASRDASTSTSAVGVQLQVRNTGNVPVNYSDLKVRYYLTRDGASTLVANIDYAKLGASNIGVRVVNLAAPVSGADAYVEFTFSAALGVFYPRTSTEDILAKIRRDDYGPLSQNNDYTFSGSTMLTVNTRFPAYLNNALVFGTPPSGTPAVVAPTNETSAKAGADEASIVAAAGASRELTFTGSPNPFGEQLHLTFALPTTQAYTLAVYDGQGRLVQQLAHGQAEAGQAQQVEVPTQTYAAGLYLVRLTTATGTQHLKLIKQ